MNSYDKFYKNISKFNHLYDTKKNASSSVIKIITD